MGAGFLSCLALAAAPRPRLLLNTTASVPVGLYRLSSPGEVSVGDLVVVTPDPELAAFLEEGGWLPRGVPLLKPVAAAAGQSVCRRALDVTIDGRLMARALKVDGLGRRLPTWNGCRLLEPGEVFLLATAFGSVDGRYFGVTDSRQVVARAQPVWITRSEVTP